MFKPLMYQKQVMSYKGSDPALSLTFSASTGLDPVITGGTSIVWTSPTGATSTGGTPSPALAEAGKWVVTMDDYSAVTALNCASDTVVAIEDIQLLTSMTTFNAENNAALGVDTIVSDLNGTYGTRSNLVANIGGTCPAVSGDNFASIQSMTNDTWTYNSDAFLFTVKSDNTGTSNNDQFTIPKTTGTYDYTVYFDGTSETNSDSSDHTIEFPSGAGTYTIAITGTFPRIYFNGGGDEEKLTGITQFGDVSWGTVQSYAFYGCNKLLTQIPALPSNLEDTSWMFGLCSILTGTAPSLPAGVVDASVMFYNCYALEFVGDHSAADGTLTTINGMFNGCSALTGSSEDFWNWSTPPSGNTTNCYKLCTSLTDYATIPAAYGGGGA